MITTILLAFVTIAQAGTAEERLPLVIERSLKPGAESVLIRTTDVSTEITVEVLVNGIVAGRKKFAGGGQVSVTLDRKLAPGDVVRVREFQGRTGSPLSKEEMVKGEPGPKPAPPVIIGERLRAGARTVSVQTGSGGTVKVFMEGREITAGAQKFDVGGDVTVSLKQPLQEGAHVRATLTSDTEQSSDPSPEKEVPFSTDWGRVRAQFWGGAMVGRSDTDGTLSERDPYIALTVETAVRSMVDHNCACEMGSRLRRWQATTEVDIRLTSTSVSAPAAAGNQAAGAGPETLETVDSTLFRGSFVFPIRTANFGAPISERPWADGADLLFVAPIVSLGFESANDSGLPEARKRQLFKQVMGGLRLGHARVSRDSDAVNQTYNYVTVGIMHAENYRGEDGRIPKRWFFEARLRLPGLAPILIGTDLNLGDGPDDSRFIFGTTFDVGNMLRKLSGS